MLKLIVSNRESQVAWLRRHPAFRDFQHVRWLGDYVKQLQPGDVVAGSLPLDVAAEICARGADYWNVRTRRNQAPAGDLTDRDRDNLTSVVSFRVSREGRIL